MKRGILSRFRHAFLPDWWPPGDSVLASQYRARKAVGARGQGFWPGRRGPRTLARIQLSRVLLGEISYRMGETDNYGNG